MTYYPPRRRPVYNPDAETQPMPPYDPNGQTQPNQPPQQPGQYPPPYNPQPPQPGQYPPPYNPPPSPPKYLDDYQPIRKQRRKPRRTLRLPGKGCCIGVLAILGVLVCLAVAFVSAAFVLAPGKTNILVLGIDRVSNSQNSVGRSDTIVMAQVDPAHPRIATLAIPRDLWVNIPGVGENRINTAHFFAEANQAGTGPEAAAQTIEANFGIASKYYVRVHLEGVPALVDAMGGVTVDLTEATALYPVGTHHLNGTQALAFIRDRKNADDFFRMSHGEIFIKAAAKQMLNPLTWVRLPFILAAVPGAVDTNIPTTMLPAMAITLLRVGPGNIDAHTLPREDTTPFTTSAGAQVLLPQWDRINPLVKEIFGN
jgi:LCP family protein required for cell wall assembly